MVKIDEIRKIVKATRWFVFYENTNSLDNCRYYLILFDVLQKYYYNIY